MKNSKKMYRILFFLIIMGMLIFSGCGKPHQAASIDDGKTTGGYTVISRFQTPGYANDLFVKDNMAYMAQGEGGLVIVDIADRQNPEIVSITIDNVRGYSSKITMGDSLVYIAAGSFGVTVVNVIDPYHPEVTDYNTSMKPAKNVHIMGKYLFTAISEQGVSIAELSFPSHPDDRGRFTPAGYTQSVVTTSDSVFAIAACGEMGLSLFDISFMDGGFGDYPMVGWCDTPGYANDVDINDEESVAFLACGLSGLQIIDYSDTLDVHLIGSLDEGWYAKEIMWEDDLVYMTVELGGLQIIDVSDPTAPYLVGEIETEYALGVHADEDYVYVADEKEGLIIIQKPD